MAQALLNYQAGEHFDVFSAGTRPEPIDPRTIETLKQCGVNTDALVSTDIKQFTGQSFDFVISLCASANAECRRYPGASRQFAWQLNDPKRSVDIHAFSKTLNDIKNILTMFILIETGGEAEVEQPDELPEPTLDPVSFYKTLTDDIRLKTLMLTHYHGELCVCELMTALAEDSQPKISRNLAVLRNANIITDRKNGQWVFYQINPNLAQWAKSVIAMTTHNNITLISEPLKQLANMNNRPDKSSYCK